MFFYQTLNYTLQIFFSLNIFDMIQTIFKYVIHCESQESVQNRQAYGQLGNMYSTIQ